MPVRKKRAKEKTSETTLDPKAVKAREIARKKTARSPEKLETLSPAETRRLIRELRRHQIELETQNEELHRAHTELEQRAAERMVELGRANEALRADITERTLMEQDLQNAHTLFNCLIDQSPMPMWISDETGTLIRINPACCEALNITQEAVMDKYNIFNDNIVNEQGCMPMVRAVFEKGWIVHFEIIYDTAKLKNFKFEKSASVVFDVTIFPIKNLSGKITNAVIQHKDITEQRRSEEALRIKNWAIESATNAIATADMEGNLDYVNPAFLKLWGYSSPAEVLGKPSVEFRPKGEKVTKILEALRTQGSWIGELVAPRKDGALVDVHVAASVVVNDVGQAVGMQASFADITARKRAEEALRESEGRYKRITEGLTDYQYTVRVEDGRAVETRQGPACATVTGYTAEEFVADAYLWFRMVAPEDRKLVQERTQQILAGNEIAPIEHRIVRKDGETRWVRVSVILNKDAAGKLLSYDGVIKDITEHKQAEEEKAKLEAQLRQAQKMESVGRLAGGVAHDFNNMLSVILGYTELGLKQVDPARPLHTELMEIRKAAERAADLTRQLLAFARKQTVAPRVLDLNETVAGMLKMLQRIISEDICLNWQPKPDLWPIKVDPSQINQILANLCVNARDAIADVGKIIVETGNSTLDAAYCADHPGFAAGEYVRLAVSDDGCGMDKETLTHLFEPFFTTKGIGKGTGLGLATVYGIVKQNNGFIDVHSEPGSGTKFTIYLPRHVGKAEPVMQTESAAKPALRGRETILLVEDEPAVLSLITLMLEKQGYTVLAASTPGEAIRLAREYAGEIHLLMTDVVMPEMNGRDLAKNLLSLYPDLKRLFMSGYTADLIAHHGVLDEGVHFIQKPISIKDLAAKMREVLDSE